MVITNQTRRSMERSQVITQIVSKDRRLIVDGVRVIIVVRTLIQGVINESMNVILQVVVDSTVLIVICYAHSLTLIL